MMPELGSKSKRIVMEFVEKHDHQIEIRYVRGWWSATVRDTATGHYVWDLTSMGESETLMWDGLAQTLAEAAKV